MWGTLTHWPQLISLESISVFAPFLQTLLLSRRPSDATGLLPLMTRMRWILNELAVPPPAVPSPATHTDTPTAAHTDTPRDPDDQAAADATATRPGTRPAPAAPADTPVLDR